MTNSFKVGDTVEINVGGKTVYIDAATVPYFNMFTWRLSKGKYITASLPLFFGERSIHLHGLVMYGVFKHRQTKRQIDHIDGNGLNNTYSNLRFVTSAQNHMNMRSKRGTSRFKGVYWCKQTNKWKGQLIKDGRKYYLGLFENEIDAASAYDTKAIEMFGEYAALNFRSIGASNES